MNINLIIFLHVHHVLANAPDIARPFSLHALNTSFPQIHGRQLNFWKAGGGDNHLYLAPAGGSVANNTLVAGVLMNREWWEGKSVPIRCVINGEVVFPPVLSPREAKLTGGIVHPKRQHHKGVYDPAR